MTINGVPRPLNWKELYQLAMVELDVPKLPPLIADAQKAILDRIEETLTRPNSGEHQQLNDALHGLHVLRQEVNSWLSKPAGNPAEN